MQLSKYYFFFQLNIRGKIEDTKFIVCQILLKKIMLITINTDEAERHKVEVTKFSSTGNFNILNNHSCFPLPLI